MGDFETVVKNAKAGQEIVLQEDYTGSLTIFDWIRLNLNKKTVTGTITVDLSGKKADGSRGAVEIVPKRCLCPVPASIGAMPDG